MSISSVRNLASLSLEIFIQLFYFPFLFSRFCCHSVSSYVTIVITGCCNQFSLASFSVFLEFLNFYIISMQIFPFRPSLLDI